jgi:hypothetical protein
MERSMAAMSRVWLLFCMAFAEFEVGRMVTGMMGVEFLG